MEAYVNRHTKARSYKLEVCVHACVCVLEVACSAAEFRIFAKTRINFPHAI